ncbi:MAG: DEAD/DEAH box helicase [Armatimonadota bacterium]|nr:DEAD/DEAH box helicase [Armatimonadota bacterium]
MSFTSLGLRAELLRALSDAGYETPTPVQSGAIPEVLQGRDVLAGAQTGTGKTAAFALPILQRLVSKPQRLTPHQVRVLILTPTRELAAQVEESVAEYGKYLSITSAVVFGGVNINPQIQQLNRGVDVLVATPGRLLDHVGQRTVDLSRVEIFVLDEADRMLDMGFIRDIRKVLALLPAKRQNLLFSATFPDEIKTLANTLLHNPAQIEVARQSAESELVTQTVYGAEKEHKRDLLIHLIGEKNISQALVFTRTKHGADRLAKQLGKAGISAAAIHGDRSQPQRTRALADFKAGSARVLVATDIAARGLDIDQLPHVINYELPHVPEDYVHRIGRTGRAGSLGDAISLVSLEEEPNLAAIEKLLRKRLPRHHAQGFVPPVIAPPAVAAPPPRSQAPRPARPAAPRNRWGR